MLNALAESHCNSHCKYPLLTWESWGYMSFTTADRHSIDDNFYYTESSMDTPMHVQLQTTSAASGMLSWSNGTKFYKSLLWLTVRSSVHVGFAFIVIFACKECWVQSKPFRISLFPISHFLFPHFPFLVLPVPDYVAPTCCSYLHKLTVARVSTLNIFYFSNSTQ